MIRGKGVGMTSMALPNAASSSRMHVPNTNQHKLKNTKDSSPIARKGSLGLNSDNCKL